MAHFYDVQALFEISVDVRGCNYLVIYGKHVNGYFCCIPNWKAGCEMAEPSDTFYNAEKLRGAGFSGETAKELAALIRKAAMLSGAK